ncbi:hypothetical protein ACP70R_021395 [Stipagrostis hirtigluma subsp. patula]
MGRWHRSSNNVLRRDDEAASLFDQPPLSAGSAPSPAPLLHGKEATERMPPATRRHAVMRSICSPVAAVFRRMTCVHAAGSGDDDDRRGNDETCRSERGEARTRRPSLEELLRMEAPASRPEHESSPPDESPAYEAPCGEAESAVVVFGFAGDNLSCAMEEEGDEEEEDEMPLAVSENRHVVSDEEQLQATAAIVPVELDLQRRPVAPDDGRAGLSRTVQMRVQRVVLILASVRRTRSRALRGDAGASKALYRKLAAGSRGAGKAELFYHRPISMGRRCRVQHLEDSPYA